MRGNSVTHRSIHPVLAAALFWIAILLSAPPARAAGLLIADGGFGGVLDIKEHDVRVTINNGVAVTHVTQVFHNTEKRQVEALYTFPVPRGASVANFSMWINGKEMVGEVLEKQRAREIYNSYKAKRRDPGLLEQVDYKTFEMRIFPINANADQKVQITYYQELDVDHDRAVYVYPLATVTRKDIHSRTTGKFAINVSVRSAIPVQNLASPSHSTDFVVADHTDTHQTASLETTGGSLEGDVVIAYDLARPQTGMDLVTSRESGEDGYFLLTLTAGKELSASDTGMDYVFLMDISGSMGTDGKLILSKDAVAAFIDELTETDQFEVMTFNVKPDWAFGRLRGADPDARDAAKAYMSSRQAKGGTTLAPAMTTAYKYGNPDRTLNVVILSDGMTEQAERKILMDLIASRPSNARVFCIGIGNEVNRPLLEQMAEDSGGLAAFISHGDNFRRQAQGFRRKLMRPVAADLRVDFAGIRVFDVEPQKLPNLYHGAPIRIYGRYAGSGEGEIHLTANLQGVEMKQSTRLMFPDIDADNPEIERMWAWKRVDRLLKTAERAGSRAPVIEEIVRLGEAFSIVTEYTSFIVLENDAEYQRWKIERRNTRRMERDRKAQARRERDLAAIRGKAIQNIGPQPPARKRVAGNTPALQPQAQSPPPAATPPAPVASAPARRSNQSSNFNLNFGSGPVGPLFIGLSWWLRRKRRQS